jgi:hypothetical protein
VRFNRRVAAYTKFVIELMQEWMEPTEALRILGTIAERDETAMLGGEPIGRFVGDAEDNPEVLEMLSRAFSTRYDVVIGSKPLDPTARVAHLNMLLRFRELGMAIPDDELVKAAGDAGLPQRIVKRIIGALAEQAAAAAVPPLPAGTNGGGVPASGQTPGILSNAVSETGL